MRTEEEVRTRVKELEELKAMGIEITKIEQAQWNCMYNTLKWFLKESGFDENYKDVFSD